MVDKGVLCRYSVGMSTSTKTTADQVNRLAGQYQRLLAKLGENNMATQRAEWAYRAARQSYNATHSKKI